MAPSEFERALQDSTCDLLVRSRGSEDRPRLTDVTEIRKIPSMTPVAIDSYGY
jgi:hypothetical protein